MNKLDIHPNDFKVGDMVQMLNLQTFGVVTCINTSDAGMNFYDILWLGGEELVDPPFQDIAWGEDLRLLSRGNHNEEG